MSARLELIAGDYCADGRGNTGIVRLCKKGTPNGYLRVLIVNGPRRGAWEPTYRFQPLLDHPGGTVRGECLECGRPYLDLPDPLLARDGRQFPKDDKCRTHLGHPRTEAQRERDRRIDDVGDYDRRTKHHAR